MLLEVKKIWRYNSETLIVEFLYYRIIIFSEIGFKEANNITCESYIWEYFKEGEEVKFTFGFVLVSYSV